MISTSKIALELLIGYAVCFALTVANIICLPMGAPWSDIAWVIACLSLVAVPLVAVRHIHPRSEEQSGIVLHWSAKDLLTGIIVTALLLLPVALGNHFVRTAILEMHFQWNTDAHLTAAALAAILYQFATEILCVAFPEEFFFRGYLQTNISKLLAKSRLVSSPHITATLSILLSASAFALLHLPSGDASRLLTFFPGLLFGAIRHHTGGLLGAIFCHAGCNMMMLIFNAHYFAS